MVRAPAANVNVTLFDSATPVSPTAAIVALPFQVPANAAGIVGPVAAGRDDAAGDAEPDLAVAAGLGTVPSSPPAGAMTAAAAPPQAASSGPRLDRGAGVAGPEGWPG